ncbi:hypothetical protein H6P81_005872 [Aristolochia fimbriata]|uniref:Myb-like domain-containing protein n=1 Tax=Aristolochia fimbriata TaxID=158543 RepID=A0AAV7EW67_ARIFI|nr:hypothetical protein H6P81_005872 [Aristolochia fimbriata]
MQSGYGVPEIQQFMVDSCASLLSISHDMGSPSNQQKHQQQHHHHHHPQQQQQQQQHQPHQTHQRFHPLSPIPITQQFFQHHPFHPYQHQQRRLHHQLGLDQESEPHSFVGTNFKLGVNESSCSRQALQEETENSILRCEDGSESSRPLHRWQEREEESAIKEPFWKPLDIEYLNRNNKRACKEKHQVLVSTTTTTNTSAAAKISKKNEDGSNGNETEEGKSSGSNYGLFSELEAIYTRSSASAAAAAAAGGSGSALTGENNGPTNAAATAAGPSTTTTRAAPPQYSGFDHGSSETSTGEEASLRINDLHNGHNNTNNNKGAGGGGVGVGGKMMRATRWKRKRKQMSFLGSFFQSLVKQLMEHQESLHRKFLELMERRDRERSEREEEWRRQEAAKANREAMARVQEQALASSREAAIISFLEKITGESIDFPAKTTTTTTTPQQYSSSRLFKDPQLERHKKSDHLESTDDDHHLLHDQKYLLENNLMISSTTRAGSGEHHQNKDTKKSANINCGSCNNDPISIDNHPHGMLNIESSSTINGATSRRWPKAEVQALIRVRSSLESRFQEPGLKAPLWEEVSASMASLGYQRSAKRCKEKWENINKYFRKTKDSAKKRPQQSKTCPYFHQLDQLYSKAQNNYAAAASSVAAAAATSSTTSSAVVPLKDHDSELLDAIVVAPSHDLQPHDPAQNSSHLGFVDPDQMRTNFKFPDQMGPLNLDFNGGDKDGNGVTELNAGQVLLQLQQDQGNNEEDEDDGREEDHHVEADEEDQGDQEEEEEGETDDQEHEENHINDDEHEEKDRRRLQENMFFRVES